MRIGTPFSTPGGQTTRRNPPSCFPSSNQESSQITKLEIFLIPPRPLLLFFLFLFLLLRRNSQWPRWGLSGSVCIQLCSTPPSFLQLSLYIGVSHQSNSVFFVPVPSTWLRRVRFVVLLKAITSCQNKKTNVKFKSAKLSCEMVERLSQACGLFPGWAVSTGGSTTVYSVILIGPVNYTVLYSKIRTSHSIDDGKLCTNPALFVSDLQDDKKNSLFFVFTF